MMMKLMYQWRADRWRSARRGRRWTPSSIVVTLVLITLLCVPVVIVQQNWAGLAVFLTALSIAMWDVMVAIRRSRDNERGTRPAAERDSRRALFGRYDMVGRKANTKITKGSEQ
jgi:hypothetical protein